MWTIATDGKKKRFLFSGDVGRGGNEVLRDPVPVADVDFLLMESTYGGREHEAPPGVDEHFGEIIRRAHKRGGKILIPAFAVERTQQLLYVLNELFERGAIPEVPVFVDSPLAVSATEIYRLHPDAFNDEVYKSLYRKAEPVRFRESHAWSARSADPRRSTMSRVLPSSFPPPACARRGAFSTT